MAERTKPIRRVVSVEFWSDDKVLDNFSPEDKLFMLYLLTNPQSTQLGVYNINKKTMAYELGYSVETITVLLDRFERVYDMIRYSQDTHEIAIKNYLRHSILAGGKPVEDLLRKEIKAVKNTELLDYAFQNALQDEQLNASVRAVINAYYESCDESSNESRDESSTNRVTNRTTIGGASIINNHISNNHSTEYNHSISNTVVVVNNNKDARAHARGETNNDDDNPFGDGGEDHPTETLASYAANNIMNMNGRNMEFLLGYVDILPEPVIRYAIDLANKCCRSGVPTYKYLERILTKYVSQKIQTVEQAQALEAARDAEKERGTQKRPMMGIKTQDNRLLNAPFY